MTELIETKNTSNKILLLIILSITCCVSFFLIYGNKKIINSTSHLDSNFGNMVSLPISVNPLSKVTPYNGEILIVDQSKLKTINLKNETTWEENIQLNSAVVQVNGDNILAFDKGGTQILGYFKKKIAYKKTIDGQIINGGQNENGITWIYTKNKDINNLLVFDSKGIKINDYTCPKDGFIVDTDISHDNKYIAVATILTRNDKISSKIDFFKLNSEINKVPIFSIIKEDMLICKIKIFNNDVVFFSDDTLGCLDNSGNFKWKKDLKNIKVDKIDISSRKYIVLETNKVGDLLSSGAEILTLDDAGTQLGKNIKLQGVLNFIDCHPEYFLVSDSKNIYSVFSGNIIWSSPISKGIKDIKSFTGETKILIVKNNEVDVLNIE